MFIREMGINARIAVDKAGHKVAPNFMLIT
jgi:hypothetical protein